MPRQDRSKRIKWKTLFIILAAINIVAILTLAVLIFWPVKEETYPEYEQQKESNSSQFIVRTTKKNINEMIAAYLANVSQDNKYNFKVRLEEDVHLRGELPVFSSSVPLSVHLDPIVQENGDAILKVKTISVGMLELPNKNIMEYIRDHLPMPEWVKVNPRGEEIYVALTKMDIKSNFRVQAAHIDLPENNIAFKISVPYDTIGLD
ncbi:YpmS family protein [Aciduricibacillus chroicocephali]|uniref:YpmS family protein n=1 Tax=Aciduricibacillus chroicocephali TaxID=3054939 RepID=A0ABY9KTT5_9BACI|nr:YpmS family protein [Bacillaceae bacterium 44XB]